MTRQYQGEKIKIVYDVSRCTHAAECVKGLPEVFDTDRRPWIRPDKATPQDVARVILRCPTGALSFDRLDGGPQEKPPERNHIMVSPDGPLYCAGDIVLIAANEQILTKAFRLALCRCGKSANSPFCDGSHEKHQFHDLGTVTDAPRKKEIDDTTEKLMLTCRRNGPIKFTGAVEIQSADGATCVKLTEGALCRCGASRSKPFCDGSHKNVGFVAE